MHIYDMIKKMLSIIASDMNKTIIYTNTSVDYDLKLGRGTISLSLDSTPSSFTTIWPHYQTDFCFVYSNSRKLSVSQSFDRSFTFRGYVYTIGPILISWVYYFLIMKFK